MAKFNQTATIKTVNKEGHAVDLQGYGTQQFSGPHTNIISGWSEKVFDFILLAEQGEGNLEKRIAEYVW